MRRLLLALLLVACTPEPPPAQPPGTLDVGEDVRVTIDGHPITDHMVEVALAPAPPEVRDRVRDSEEETRALLESMALTELLYHQALEKGVHDRPEVKDAMALAQREILGSFLLKELADARVTDEAVQERYTAMGTQLNRPNARIHHILVDRQDLANQLVTQINAGEIDFNEAARKHSIEAGAKDHGGDLGWSLRAPIRELQEAWESAPLNEVVGPVEGRLGFHIMRIVERRPSVPLEDVEPKIRESLRQEALKTLRTELMAEAEIVWADEADPTTPEQDAGESVDAGGPAGEQR